MINTEIFSGAQRATTKGKAKRGMGWGWFARSKLTIMAAVQITHVKTPKVTNTKAKNANKQVQTGENLLKSVCRVYRYNLYRMRCGAGRADIALFPALLQLPTVL